MKYTDVFPVPDLLPADWADVPRDQRPVTLEVDHLVACSAVPSARSRPSTT